MTGGSGKTMHCASMPDRILIEAKVRAELLFWYEYDLEGNDNQGGFDMRLGKIVTCDLKVLHDASGHTG